MAGQPDPEEYQSKRKALQTLMILANSGYIDLRFGDETGFSRLPNIPYGWLPKGKQTGIKADNKRVLNLFGLMSLDQKLTSYPTTQTVNAQFLIRSLDDFATSIDKPTVVVLDQAPWHTAQSIKERIPLWQEKTFTSSTYQHTALNSMPLKSYGDSSNTNGYNQKTTSPQKPSKRQFLPSYKALENSIISTFQ